LLGLIGDILDLAKIEAGRMEIVPEQVDIEQVVRAAGATAEPLARKGANRLLVEAERGLAGVWTDPAKVRQCVLNLLSNAAKFTVEGDITLRAAPGQRNGARVVVISVNDTGIGMSDEELQRLFQPFVQATSSTSTRYGGTGLGLSITRQICQLLGGDVEVESVRGVGSRFTMFFPLIMYADRPDAVGQCA